MRLSKQMIEIFPKIAAGNNTIEGLAKSQNKSVNWITEVVQELENEGFVIKRRSYKIRGSRIVIELASTNHALKLKELIFQYQTIEFKEILSNSKVLFLAALSEDWTNMKIATELSNISKYAVERYRPMMKNRGIITERNNLYKINEKAWPVLRDFLIAYKNYSTILGQVKWKYNEESLFQVNSEKLIQDNTTGFYEYKNYGVSIGVISALCIQPKKNLSKEEIFVHSLFEVDDPRTLHLALTFYLKNNLSYEKVIPIAMKYGKYSMFENFVKLLKTKEEKIKFDYLPTYDRKDFIRIANMYGVKNV